MDLSKIKTLIEFVGRSNVTELSVTEKDVTVRIFRSGRNAGSPEIAEQPVDLPAVGAASAGSVSVTAPVFGILHRAPAPGQRAFVALGDTVEEGQTLFIIEAMKVFNTIAAPRAGQIVSLSEIDGGEVETGELLAEIA